MTGPTPPASAVPNGTAAAQGTAQAGAVPTPDAVTPEEQAQYEQAMNNAWKLIYSEKAFPTVLERLQATDDPVEGLASVTATTVSRLVDTSRKSGAVLSPEVLFQVGTDLIEDLSDLAEKAGIHTYTPEEAEGALYRALDIFRDMHPDMVDAEGAMGDLAELKAVQDSGELDKRFPQLAEHAAKRQAPAEEPAEGEEPAEEDEEPAPSRGLLKGRR